MKYIDDINMAYCGEGTKLYSTAVRQGTVSVKID